MTGPLWKPTRTAIDLMPISSSGGRLLDGTLHLHGGFAASRAVEKVHITSSPMVLMMVPRWRVADCRQYGERLGDDGLGARVAERLVELRAAAYVDKQDGAGQTSALKLRSL